MTGNVLVVTVMDYGVEVLMTEKFVNLFIFATLTTFALSFTAVIGLYRGVDLFEARMQSIPGLVKDARQRGKDLATGAGGGSGGMFIMTTSPLPIRGCYCCCGGAK